MCSPESDQPSLPKAVTFLLGTALPNYLIFIFLNILTTPTTPVSNPLIINKHVKDGAMVFLPSETRRTGPELKLELASDLYRQFWLLQVSFMWLK